MQYIILFYIFEHANLVYTPYNFIPRISETALSNNFDDILASIKAFFYLNLPIL